MTDYLNNINSPADLKKLSVEQLPDLAEEIRQTLLDRLMATGGHAGPNLGMVEATIALHYVFDSPADKFVFDVSHQCYVHKMLTGRKDGFTDPERGYLFTGDLIYKDTLFAYYPSTDPGAYLSSLEKMALLPVERVFPAHHSLDIQPEIIGRMRDAFGGLKEGGKLRHGSGTFDYGDWAVWL